MVCSSNLSRACISVVAISLWFGFCITVSNIVGRADCPAQVESCEVTDYLINKTFCSDVMHACDCVDGKCQMCARECWDHKIILKCETQGQRVLYVNGSSSSEPIHPGRNCPTQPLSKGSRAPCSYEENFLVWLPDDRCFRFKIAEGILLGVAIPLIICGAAVNAGLSKIRFL